MNQEMLTELVLRSQSEDYDAMEQLLFHAHTPVSFLCRKLLCNAQAAQEQTADILSIVYRKLNTLQDPEHFEDWLCRITAARCLQILPQLRWGADDPETFDEKPLPDLAGAILDANQTADAIGQLLECLPDDQRICLLLYCCAGMNSRTAAQVGGYSIDAVRTNLSNGQHSLQEYLEQYLEEGTQFSGITSLQDILHAAMYLNVDEEAALPVVYNILGKEIPVPPDPEKRVIRILTIIFVVLLIADLLVGGLLVWRLIRSLSI